MVSTRFEVILSISPQQAVNATVLESMHSKYSTTNKLSSTTISYLSITHEHRK